MFIELVDSLRCVEPHEDTWLVAAVSRMDGRHIMDGVLGCPICRREYPVRDGVGWFTPPTVPPAAPHESPRAADRTARGDRELAERAGALLGLLDPGGVIVLGGRWVGCSDLLADVGPAHVVVLDPSAVPSENERVSAIRVAERLPFAAASLRGVALDEAPTGTELLASSVSALRSRGRLVAPAGAPLPDGVVELARDAEDWVAERAAVASAPVPLRSTRR